MILEISKGDYPPVMKERWTDFLVELKQVTARRLELRPQDEVIVEEKDV